MKSNFLLCFLSNRNIPQRNISDKWYVTREEYNEEEYPPYCSGSAYVTKIKTMKRIVSRLDNLNYLFIDDLLVTGIAAKGITDHYDWSKSFLESHTDSAAEILSPNEPLYTPELLAAMNLNSTSILHLYKKSKTCYNHPKCYSLLKQLSPNSVRPTKLKSKSYAKSEL